MIRCLPDGLLRAALVSACLLGFSRLELALLFEFWRRDVHEFEDDDSVPGIPCVAIRGVQ